MQNTAIMANQLIPSPTVELLRAEKVPALLDRVRPQWQARNLLERVRRLVEVDPSSACQRIFNAAVHDLREKIIVAGVDIAREAASQHKLPPVNKDEDVENYSSSGIIDLSYRMGLVSRPDWRRIKRCYEIRRDLEHEDDEYEAGIEDIIYIFNTCIEVVLSKDPIQLVKLTDFKDLVEQAESTVPSEALIEDFASAPQSRQEDIFKFLISTALDKNKPDLVQQNSYNALSYLSGKIHVHVRANLGAYLQSVVGRTITDRQARVAEVSGLMPYIRQSAKAALFEEIYKQMEAASYDWSGYNLHGELLRNFEECGGLQACPPEQKRKILRWMVLTFIGKPGGVTQFGNLRKVYYSNTAAPLIEKMVEVCGATIQSDLDELAKDKLIKQKIENQDVARRFEKLLDLVEGQ